MVCNIPIYLSKLTEDQMVQAQVFSYFQTYLYYVYGTLFLYHASEVIFQLPNKFGGPEIKQCA